VTRWPQTAVMTKIMVALAYKLTARGAIDGREAFHCREVRTR